MKKSNLKNIRFRVNTTYTNDEFYGYVKRTTHKNTLYLYIYKRGLFKDILLLSLRVSVHER